MRQIRPRIPRECPAGFFRYTVVSGDTIFLLGRELGVDDGLIIANNPHITNPALIFPGDVLCLPRPINFPCCALLRPVPGISPEAAGSILVRQLANGRQSATITAVGLPVLPGFDTYGGEIEIVGIGGFGFLLTPVTGEVTTWAGTVIIPRPVLFAGAEVRILPLNTQTGAIGNPVLTGNLMECARALEPKFSSSGS